MFSLWYIMVIKQAYMQVINFSETVSEKEGKTS